MRTGLESPYPYYGGKSESADVIWRGLGEDVNHYVEPFFGSNAILLARPGGAGKIETINDIDGGVCNFWRAIAADPEAVARHCSNPVSELDMHAKHKWLVERLEVMAEQLREDPFYFDAQVAGFWCWGIAIWIGTGWCGGVKHGNPRPNLNGGQGVHALGTRELPNQRPFVSGSSEGMGVHRGSLKQQMPKISVSDGAAGHGGVHAAAMRSHGLPAIGNDRGINGLSAPPTLQWFLTLQQRMRHVRVINGDWTRVLGPSVLGKGKNVGGRRPCAVVLDPPYETTMRARRIYNADEAGLSAKVRDWAIEHGDDRDLRVVLCGYAGEHEMPSNWTKYAWKGARGYAASDNNNRDLERIWFSPHCLPIDQQRSLFE